MRPHKLLLHAVLAVFLLASFFLSTGCKKSDNSIESDQVIETEATQDAAEAIAASVAVNNGGAMDVVEDMLDVATPGGVVASADDGSGQVKSVQKQYDSTNGWWTVTISRQRGNELGQYYSTYQRVTKHQFLNKNGIFQKNYITLNNGVNDTAYTINHEIVSGSAVSHTPRVSHKMSSLSGKWVVTNTNTPVVTLNSVTGFPFTRNADDTITRLNSLRTLNSSLNLSFTNVTGPRVSRVNWHQATSGTITGHYHALVTFTKGTVYKEKIIDRDINITLGGERIKIKVGNTTFTANAETGEVY